MSEINDLATDKQKMLLNRMGIKFENNITKREASHLIDANMNKGQAGNVSNASRDNSVRTPFHRPDNSASIESQVATKLACELCIGKVIKLDEIPAQAKLLYTVIKSIQNV